MRCGGCKAEHRFVPPGVEIGRSRWLIIGGQDGSARLAAPIPINEPLRVGRSAALWLSLPGEDVADEQAELLLRSDGRLEVRHLAGDGGTWIDRAKIAKGVLVEGKHLLIGPYVLRMAPHTKVRAVLAAASEPEVIIEEGDGGGEEEVETPGGAGDIAAAGGGGWRNWTKGQRVRAAICALVVLSGGALLAKSYVWPSVSEEMPTDTVFYCPVDGTEVRGRWTSSSGAPVCPRCGQRCVGELKYKPEITGPAATQPGGGEHGESGLGQRKGLDGRSKAV